MNFLGYEILKISMMDCYLCSVDQDDTEGFESASQNSCFDNSNLSNEIYVITQDDNLNYNQLRNYHNVSPVGFGVG